MKYVSAIRPAAGAFALFALSLFAGNAVAQQPRPVTWTFSSRAGQDGTTELVFAAAIDKGFHVYSQHIDPYAGPIPTSFAFQADESYALVDSVLEGESEEVYDPNFEMMLRYFSGRTEFVQKIRLAGDKPVAVSGTITYMVCDDNRCYPPEDLPFRIEAVKAGPASGGKEGGADR